MKFWEDARMKRFRFFFMFGLIVAGLVLGCGDSALETSGDRDPTEDGGALRIMLTDAPADILDSAMVVISRVYLVPALGDSGFVELLPDSAEPKTYDLFALRDSLEAFLAETPVPPDTFSQLRLVVDSATVSLAEGYEFRDGTTSKTLHVPSGQQSGIKVQLDEPIVARVGWVTIVVVDFDVNDNFVIQGNPESPAGIQGILFTPVLKEKGRRFEPGS
jgi:hypothetical protein